MSEEQLELIKDILDSPGEVFFGSISDDGVVSQDVTDAEPYFKWLVERVQELEKDSAEWETETYIQDVKNKRLEQQNKRYREAYEYFKDTIPNQKYVCHCKCQDVIAVEDLEEGLLEFEALEEEALEGEE